MSPGFRIVITLRQGGQGEFPAHGGVTDSVSRLEASWNCAAAHSLKITLQKYSTKNYFSCRNFSKVFLNSCKPMAYKDAWYVLIGHKVSLLLLKWTPPHFLL